MQARGHEWLDTTHNIADFWFSLKSLETAVGNKLKLRTKYIPTRAAHPNFMQPLYYFLVIKATTTKYPKETLLGGFFSFGCACARIEILHGPMIGFLIISTT